LCFLLPTPAEQAERPKTARKQWERCRQWCVGTQCHRPFTDNLGGTATTANLKPGQSTTTIESKTNFFAAVPIGDVAKAECTPLHRGRTTMVWQTRITRGDGKLCALVTQTQLVLERGK
jgi:uncharacterized protein (TIGR00369 family)